MPTSTSRRLTPIALATLILSGLALVATGAGVGYAAGQIGTNQIKNNAVTSAKVKNKTLTAKDMVKEEKQKKPTLGNGTEGDCVWQSGPSLAAGLGAPAYRMDRFGTVILSGVAQSLDAPGGDGVCDESDPGELEDGILFTLPPKYRPARTLLLPIGSTGAIVVAGPQGLVSPTVSVPAGTVFIQGGVAILDNIRYDAAGAKVVTNKVSVSGSSRGLDRLMR